VVAFADHYLEYSAMEASPGTNVIPITTERFYFRRVEQNIEAVRAAGADLVVFSVHWGPNMNHVPLPEFQEFARAVIDAGADIFHGHSAHVFQGIEIYRGRPILYDTGDLIDDYRVYEEHKNDQQFLFLVTATGGEVTSIELVPVLIADAQVNVAHGVGLDQAHQRMRVLSAAMGTEVRREGDRLVVEMTTPVPSSPDTRLPSHLKGTWPSPGTWELADGTVLLLRVDLLADQVREGGEVTSRSSLLYDGAILPLYGYTNDGGWMVEDAGGNELDRVAPRLHQLYWSVRPEPGVHQATYLFRSGSGEVLEYRWQFELVVIEPTPVR
jgi:hypothetical protein